MINKGTGRGLRVLREGDHISAQADLSLLDRLCCLTLVLSKAVIIGSEEEDVFSLIIIVHDRTGLKVSSGLLRAPVPQQKTGAALPGPQHISFTGRVAETRHSMRTQAQGEVLMSWRGKTCLLITWPDLAPPLTPCARLCS